MKLLTYVFVGQPEIRSHMPLFGKCKGDIGISDARWNKLVRTVYYRNNMAFSPLNVAVGEDKLRILPVLLDAQKVVLVPNRLYYYDTANTYNIRKVERMFETLGALKDAVSTIARAKGVYPQMHRHAKRFWDARTFMYIIPALRVISCAPDEPYSDKKMKLQWIRANIRRTHPTTFRQFVLKTLLLFGRYRLVIKIFKRKFPQNHNIKANVTY